ncbi:hypothetical protein B0A49_03710 [Cryomyces minteri]|uniref:Tubulin-folding cofactor D ARM repeats domain-containing protein n=1 Tax=Cryomyces minteri TaxID=331657 RepID=A0A4U0XG68_9PEZI|nr:hypothetical protein B0A49_03710 [Cryomyces minteri]
MDAAEDEDLALQRTTASSLSALLSLLTTALWKRPADGRSVRHVHRRVRNRDLDRIIALTAQGYHVVPFIEPFQEEPQLLDVHLKKVLPPLVTAYLEYLQRPITTVVKSGTVTLSNAVCRVVTTLCKVRGEKVIIGFLNNEPRFLEPILDAFEEGSQPEGSSVVRVPEAQSTWEERYVLLLWLSHLMLAPFDLASISSKRPTPKHYEGVELPVGLPSVAHRTVSVCALHLSSATKARDAAAKLLVRLSLRPDMRAVGLLNSLIPWSLQLFRVPLKSNTSIHHYLGHLSFLGGLVALANSDEIGAFIPSIYSTCRIIAKEDALLFVRSSALAKKLIIKSFRNIVLLCIQPTIGAIPSDFLDLDSPLEEVIDYLLNVLSDRDTPVRYAASKSLSVIALKLDPEMASEVVGAVLGSLQQDVFWDGPSRNLTAVNPLFWHGLTLTLAHFLFRRTPPTAQLPDILSALLMALTFEQRSATGGSIGTNVRDAACFGIWSLSRRYTTQELLAVDTSSIRAATRHGQRSSVIQMLAVELLVTACLDPAGNIRRGSSAALQELIGRHPDTVHEGIPLVQIVDYHAVGLRQRVMTEISFSAASLGKIYRNALFDGLFDWRGVGAPDVLSRDAAAEAIGRLSTLEVRFEVVMGMVNRVKQRLKTVADRDVEERHGLMMSLASFIDQYKDLKQLAILWSVFDESFNITDRHFTSTALRPELTVVAVSTLIYRLAQIPSINVYSYLTGPSSPAETALQIAPDAATAFVQWLPPKERERVVEEWLLKVTYFLSPKTMD